MWKKVAFAQKKISFSFFRSPSLVVSIYSFCEQVRWRTALWYDDWTHVKSGRNFSFHHDKIEFECDRMNVIVPYRISARLIARSQHKQKKEELQFHWNGWIDIMAQQSQETKAFYQFNFLLWLSSKLASKEVSKSLNKNQSEIESSYEAKEMTKL